MFIQKLAEEAVTKPPPQSVKGQAQFLFKKGDLEVAVSQPREFQRRAAMETAVTNTLGYK